MSAIRVRTAQAWIPMEGKLINNHWFDLREKPEDFRIFSIGTVRASQDR